MKIDSSNFGQKSVNHRHRWNRSLVVEGYTSRKQHYNNGREGYKAAHWHSPSTKQEGGGDENNRRRRRSTHDWM